MLIIAEFLEQIISSARFMLSKKTMGFPEQNPNRRIWPMQQSLISLLLAVVSALLILVAFAIYIGV